MNEKMMMLAQDPNASPYPGYAAAKLTIDQLAVEGTSMVARGVWSG